MSNLISWPAPAKLNLMLRITGRREDGYHLLQTVFQLLDFGDEISFEITDDGVISRAYDLPGVSAEHDLVVRAAQLLQLETGIARGVRIHLTKRIPPGGGLGGGSSDAATTLVALNRLWGCGLETEALSRMGLALGADVPVFVQGHSAWAEGVGEILEPVTLPNAWYVVLTPAVNISTAGVFSDPQLIRDSAPITIRDFLAGRGGNDCEAVVLAKYPEVAKAMTALGAHGPARMTGTGASVFAPFADEIEARAVLSALTPRWEGFAARGVSESPLLEALRKTG